MVALLLHSPYSAFFFSPALEGGPGTPDPEVGTAEKLGCRFLSRRLLPRSPPHRWEGLVPCSRGVPRDGIQHRRSWTWSSSWNSRRNWSWSSRAHATMAEAGVEAVGDAEGGVADLLRNFPTRRLVVLTPHRWPDPSQDPREEDAGAAPPGATTPDHPRARGGILRRRLVLLLTLCRWPGPGPRGDRDAAPGGRIGRRTKNR